jgi:hypothetical protein
MQLPNSIRDAGGGQTSQRIDHGGVGGDEFQSNRRAGRSTRKRVFLGAWADFGGVTTGAGGTTAKGRGGRRGVWPLLEGRLGCIPPLEGGFGGGGPGGVLQIPLDGIPQSLGKIDLGSPA